MQFLLFIFYLFHTLAVNARVVVHIQRVNDCYYIVYFILQTLIKHHIFCVILYHISFEVKVLLEQEIIKEDITHLHLIQVYVCKGLLMQLESNR